MFRGKSSFVILLSIIFISLFGSQVALSREKSWKNLRIGVEGAYPPFSSIAPGGKLVGFDIDIAWALCKEMNAKCKLVKQDWDGIIPGLLARKFDAIIASMSITEERKKKIAFTDKYYNSSASFVHKKGAGTTVSKAGLKGKTVGVQRATIHDNFLKGEFPGAKIKRYGTIDEAVLDIKAGRIEMIMADMVPLSSGFLKVKGGENFEFVGPKFTTKKYFGEGVGIGLRKRDKELKAKFNAAIKAIRSNGVYKKIQDKYFDFDIYGDES